MSQSREEKNARNRKYMKGYYQRKKKQIKAYGVAYRERPEVKKRGKAYSKAYALRNAEKIKQYKAQYFQEHKEHESKRNKDWLKSHPGKRLEYLRNTRAKNPEKYKARTLVKRVKVEGLCQRCKVNPAEEKHHPDYSKPKCVLFVCKKCHRILDKGG